MQIHRKCAYRKKCVTKEKDCKIEKIYDLIPTKLDNVASFKISTISYCSYFVLYIRTLKLVLTSSEYDIIGYNILRNLPYNLTTHQASPAVKGKSITTLHLIQLIFCCQEIVTEKFL